MEKRVVGIPDPEIDMAGLCRVMSNASPVPVAAVAGVGNIIRYVNPAFCVLAGQSAEKLLGTAFSEAVPAGHYCLALLDRVYRTAQPETHTGGDGLTDSVYWSYAMWPAVTADGESLGIIIQVTETNAAHEQTAVLNQALIVGAVRQHRLTETAEALNVQLHAEMVDRERAQEELRRANLDLQQFTYAVTHDLHEPLRTVAAYTQLLARRLGARVNAEEQVFVDFILQGTHRMGELIKDLLAHARLGDAAEGDKVLVDCANAVTEAMANLGASIQESQAVVTVGALPVVKGDFSQIVQLFQNLIGNALKYRKHDSSLVPEIRIAADRQDGGWSLISVRDNGIGINPQYAEQIFGIFRRLHGAEYSGTGIGLAICKRIVERLGGRLWVESEEGRGATFFFTLREVSVADPGDLSIAGATLVISTTASSTP